MTSKDFEEDLSILSKEKGFFDLKGEKNLGLIPNLAQSKDRPHVLFDMKTPQMFPILKESKVDRKTKRKSRVLNLKQVGCILDLVGDKGGKPESPLVFKNCGQLNFKELFKK